VNRLYICPGAPLDDLAFAELWNRHRSQWLVDRFATSLVLDPSLLAIHPSAMPEPQRGVLAVGDPKVSASDFLRDLTFDGVGAPKTLQLPGARNELDAVVEAYHLPKSDVVTWEKATEANFRELASNDYRIIALATHAITHLPNGRDPRPAIVFTPGAGDAHDDGLLHGDEIEDLHLNADLVIMSACQTASGNGLPGAEALSGLAQAFFYAGARKVVATLWSVESISAGHLITGMARLAGANRDPAVDLQASMIALKKNPARAHPAFWAPFVVVDGFGL
jgi:CHAT domain-containing protein